jgi:D-Tyr-tRNAtyr deacylase
MIGLLQRVRQARVEVQNQTIAEIGIGLLVFVGV